MKAPMESGIVMNRAPLSSKTLRSKENIIPLFVWYVDIIRMRKEMTKILLRFMMTSGTGN